MEKHICQINFLGGGVVGRAAGSLSLAGKAATSSAAVAAAAAVA